MVSRWGSAIDDSFTPLFCPPETPLGPGPSTYNGPRCGYWTVSSSVGSAIDDRGPPGLGSAPSSHAHSVSDGDRGQRGAHAIDDDLFKRLRKLGVERERQRHEDAQPAKQSAPVRTVEVKSLRIDESKPKRFYVRRAVGGQALKISRKEDASSALAKQK
jgi:hypothetical protein